MLCLLFPLHGFLMGIHACDTGDADQDGWTVEAGDCDDLDPAIHPGASEICDGVDQDCDGEVDEDVQLTYYFDADGDGYGLSETSVVGCSQPVDYSSKSGDCDDTNPDANPAELETCADALDNDCDGIVDEECTSCSIDGEWIDNAGIWYSIEQRDDGSFEGNAAAPQGDPDHPPACWWRVWGSNDRTRNPNIYFFAEVTYDSSNDSTDCGDGFSASASWEATCNTFTGVLMSEYGYFTWSVSFID